MSSNKTPQGLGLLLPLADAIQRGAATYGVSVNLTIHTAATIKARMLKLTGDPDADPGSPENRGSQYLFRKSIDDTALAITASNELSDGPVKLWLEGYKDMLKGVLGKKANSFWATAGFSVKSIRIPTTYAKRKELLVAARTYMADHPAYEVSLPQGDAPPLVISAVVAEDLYNQMQAAESLISDCHGAQPAAKAVRDADWKVLYQWISGTIAELGLLLPKDDPRWELFGLNIPAHPTPPLGVSGLSLMLEAIGHILLLWTYARRATYFRVFMMRDGIDTDFVFIKDVYDLEYTLKGLITGTVIHVYVVPMNGAGAGHASPTETMTV